MYEQVTEDMTFKNIAIGSNCYQWQTNQADIDIDIDIDIVIDIGIDTDIEKIEE